MTMELREILAPGAAALGTWPAFAILMTLCVLFFSYLVPQFKASIFRNLDPAIQRKVLDEYVFTWTPANARSFLAAIGPEGRTAYRRFYLTMDFWFPGAIASLATASLLLIAFPPNSGLGWFCLLAIPAWLFDIAENITHFRMAGSYPNLSPMALKFGPLFTGAKWVFAILPLPVALLGFAWQLLNGF